MDVSQVFDSLAPGSVSAWVTEIPTIALSCSSDQNPPSRTRSSCLNDSKNRHRSYNLIYVNICINKHANEQIRMKKDLILRIQDIKFNSELRSATPAGFEPAHPKIIDINCIPQRRRNIRVYRLNHSAKVSIIAKTPLFKNLSLRILMVSGNSINRKIMTS